MGTLARIDLSEEKTSTEKLSQDLIDRFMGQLGIGAKLMYDEVPGHVDGFDPENRVIFMTGPFTGTGVQSPANYEVISLNPYTDNIAVANSHGFWGPRLKKAGFDGVIIQGEASSPKYISIIDDEIDIHDADEYWGLDTFDTEEAIANEFDQNVSVSCIGPAGENLVAGSAVENDKGHVASKGNVAAVLGSKNVKAVAVGGTNEIPVAKPEEFNQLGEQWREASFETALGSMVDSVGTAGFTGPIHEMGDLPTKNFTTNVFPDYENFTGDYLRNSDAMELERKPCFGCSLDHVHNCKIQAGDYEGFEGEEPEYEGFSALGSNLDISDPGAVTMLNEEADRLGFDGNHAGTLLGFVMEAYERGMLEEEDLGFSLEWGDAEGAQKLLQKVAKREDIGDEFAKPLPEAAEAVSEEATEFMAHIRGEAQHAHDVRALWGMYLGLLISGAGPRWESEGFDLAPGPNVGIEETEDRFDASVKPESARLSQAKKLFIDSTGVCYFGIDGVDFDLITDAYEALTGIEMDDPATLGERIANVERAFNLEHGFEPEDSLNVSPRLLETPKDGGAEGKDIEPHLEEMVRKYHQAMEWEWDTGKPRKEKLEALNLSDIAQEIY